MHSLISKSTIQKKSKEFGFDIIKITDPKIHKNNQRYIKDFLGNNFHGDMDWLKKKFREKGFAKKTMARCKKYYCPWGELWS